MDQLPRNFISKFSLFATLLFLGLAAWGCNTDKNSSTVEKSEPYKPTWESLAKAKAPAWWDDGKFGIMIHWGAYSVAGFQPGGKGYAEWFPHNLYADPTTYYPFMDSTFGAHPPEFGYKDIIPEFKAEHWDPAGWADLFHKAGARYVIPTAEHHDGFAMWDSKLTHWDAVEKGPKRDLIGELAKAVRAEGLMFGVSYHRSRHTGFFAKQTYTVHSEPRRDIAAEIRRMPQAAELYGPFSYTHTFIKGYVARWKELQRKYRPAFMWLDDIPIFYKDPEDPQTQKFKSVFPGLIADYLNAAQEWGKQVYVNNKGGHLNWPKGIGVREKDNLSIDSIGPRWQDPATMGTSYGYMRWEDQNDAYKSPTELIHILADVVSKNGNLLLNIGPRADGTIPEGMKRRLRAIGKWLDTNGEAIYGTRPWKTYGESHGEYLERDYYNSHCVKLHRQEVRYTQKAGAVYAISLTDPKDQLELKAFKKIQRNKINGIRLLGAKTEADWKWTDNGLQIRPPEDLPFHHAVVFKIAMKKY